MNDKQQSKKSLRKHISRERRSLTAQQQRHASLGLAKQARGFRQLLSCQRIASYAPFAGEIDPSILLAQLGAKVYLPRIVNYRTRIMQFYAATSACEISPLGIVEPQARQAPTTVKYFDAVLMPLVSFDRSGNRLGMGAGFYDRAFAFKRQSPALNRPLLIGLAHHFQESASLISDLWDVPLDAIITDHELIII